LYKYYHLLIDDIVLSAVYDNVRILSFSSSIW